MIIYHGYNELRSNGAIFSLQFTVVTIVFEISIVAKQ